MVDGYDAIISLGEACPPAFNIRQFVQNDRAFPFDWWVSSRVGIEQIIKNDFTGLYQIENMRLTPNGNSIEDTKYRIYYHHKFADVPGGPVVENFAERIPKRLERFNALAARMNAICASGRVLFVRQEFKDLRDWDGSAMATIARAVSWLEMFREKWPRGQADLLVLDSGDEIPDPLKFSSGTAFFDSVETLPKDGLWKPLAFAAIFKRHGFVSLTPRTGVKRENPEQDLAAPDWDIAATYPVPA